MHKNVQINNVSPITQRYSSSLYNPDLGHPKPYDRKPYTRAQQSYNSNENRVQALEVLVMKPVLLPVCYQGLTTAREATTFIIFRLALQQFSC